MLSFHRTPAVVLVALLAGGASSVATAPATGPLIGRVSDESKKPFINYVVRLRDVRTGALAGTMPLDPKGGFVFEDVLLGTSYLIELARSKDNSVVCTGGPYNVPTGAKQRPNVNLGCGRVPAADWVLAAAGGTAGLLAFAARRSSGSSGGISTSR
jgi:hypothetical protein